METIDGIGGDLNRSVESKGSFGQPDIVVDRLGHTHQPNPAQVHLVGARQASFATDHHKRIELSAFHGFVDHVHATLVHERGMTTGTDDGATTRQDAAATLDRQFLHRVVEQAFESFVDAEGSPAMLPLGLAHDAADDGVQAGAVSTTGQYTDCLLYTSDAADE